MHRYATEGDARAALAAIYLHSRYLAPLPTWDPQQVEPGRWRVRVYEPSASDLRQRRRHRDRAVPTLPAPAGG